MNRETATTWLVVGLINDCVKEAGKEGIPSGHLYSMLCDKMSLETFQGIIFILEKGNKITNKGHLLKTKD